MNAMDSSLSTGDPWDLPDQEPPPSPAAGGISPFAESTGLFARVRSSVAKTESDEDEGESGESESAEDEHEPALASTEPEPTESASEGAPPVLVANEAASADESVSADDAVESVESVLHELESEAPSHHVPDTVFTEVANGLPGIAVRMPLLIDLALSGVITLKDAVRLGAAAPAHLAGVFPRKGAVAEGSDADIVIWAEGAHRITATELDDAVGTTPYEGTIVGAWPSIVVSRGEVIVGEGAALEPGRGEFVRRG